jgi:hypothetical protein
MNIILFAALRPLYLFYPYGFTGEAGEEGLRNVSRLIKAEFMRISAQKGKGAVREDPR